MVLYAVKILFLKIEEIGLFGGCCVLMPLIHLYKGRYGLWKETTSILKRFHK